MADTYAIRDWDSHFEKAQCRKVSEAKWVPMPVRHDGKSYRRLMLMDDGPAIFGAWVLIVQVAAKCPTRGVLADEDGPLTAEDLAIKTGAPMALFDKALGVLSSTKIGWMTTTGIPADYQPNGIALPLQDRTGQDTTGQDKKLAPPSDGYDDELLRVIEWWNSLKANALVHSGASASPPSVEVARGWNRVKKAAVLRNALADLPRIADEIAASPICREGWFRLEKLLGGKNRDGAYVVTKLLEGAYRASAPAPRQTRMANLEAF